MAKHSPKYHTPKFIKVTVTSVEFSPDHPWFGKYLDNDRSVIEYDEPYETLINTSSIEDVFIEEGTFLTALSKVDSTYYIEEDYEDIKVLLVGADA